MNSGRGMDSPARYEMSRPQMESVGGRSMGQPASRGYSRPPLEMRQPIVMPRGGEGRGNGRACQLHLMAEVAAEAAAEIVADGGGGGSHGGGPHGGGGRR